MKTKPYRNKFEKETAEVLKNLCEYEPEKIPYTVFHTYTPDFVGKDKRGKKILVEAKGFFRVGDVQKYKAIRDSIIKLNSELIFVLYNPKKKLRKGSKMNMSEWCTKEGFRWFTVEDVVNAFTS